MKNENGKIKATKVYLWLKEAFDSGKFVIFILEGGSRSSKTTSIIQFFLLYAQANIGIRKRVIISRAVGTWITATVLQDFMNMLKDYGWYNDRSYHKANPVKYTLFDTEFWFLGLDDQQRIHGMTSNAFWINEAIEAQKDDEDQLEMRCEEFGVLDYNPSEEEHWIYQLEKRSDVILIRSTMLDNAFLPDNMRRKILSYEPTPENIAAGTADKRKWEIYGLGLRAKIEGLVFDKGFTIIEEIPSYVKKRFTGIDFGYTQDPTAIGEVGIHENAIFLDELCYRTNMLTKDIIDTLKDVNDKRKIISESADPRLVDEIYNAGFNIHSVEKGPGSVVAGLDKMKSMKMYVTARSVNAIKELKNYTHAQDKNLKYLNEPAKGQADHLIDMWRYVVMMELLGKNRKPQNIKNIANALP
jgi:phage terminase large subunit